MQLKVQVLSGLMAALIAHSASAQRPSSLVGCYGVTRSAWTPSLGADSMGYRIPTAVRLDSAVASSGGGWILGPNIEYQSKRAFPGAPRWWMNGKALRLLWSNGYAPTQVTLHRMAGRDSATWFGDAVALTDDHPLIEPPRPRAMIRLRPQPCTRVHGVAPGI